MKSKFAQKSVCRMMLCLALCCVLLLSSALTAYAAPTSKGNAQNLGQSGTVQGHLDGLGTNNWYKITPNASQYYRFTFYNQSIETRLGVSIADHFLNMFLGKMSITIYDSYDAILADGDVKCGYTGSVSLRLTQGQTYYIRLSSTVAGNYRLTTANFADIGANTWSGAEDMLANGQMISSIDASSDADWFKFVADQEQSYYRFSLENINGSGNKYFYLYEYVPGAGETPLRDVWNFSVGQGYTNSKDAQLKAGHIYYYKISGSVGGYQLNVGQTLDVAGSTFDTAYAIDTGKKYTTSFDGEGDVDYFKFTTGAKDAYYHFKVEELLNESAYVAFNLYDSAGNQVDWYNTDTYYFPKTVNYRLENNSTYYFCLSKNHAFTGNYTIQVSAVLDAYPNTREAAKQIAVGTKYTTSFDGEGDVDYFKFTTGAKDAYYHFKVEELLNGSAYIEFYLFDSAGNQVDWYSTDTYYFPKTVNYRLENNSTYYFRLSKNHAFTGNYTFQVSAVLDAYPNTREAAKQIAVGTKYTTSFDGEGDVDYFKFTTGAKDAYYHFKVEELLNGSAYIEFYLFDSAGNQVDWYSTDTYYFPKTVNYRLENNSTYYFRLSKNHAFTGNYTFQVSATADPEGNGMGAALAIARNKPKMYVLAAQDDVDWFTFTVDYDSDYRIRLVNETEGSIAAELYNQYERQIKYLETGSEWNDAVYLEAGKYYLKVRRASGSPKYYTLAAADCAEVHQQKVSYPTIATTSRNGVKKTVCTACGDTIKTEKVAYLASISLTKTKWTYTGQVITPKVQVVDADGNKVSSAYYTQVISANAKLPGNYTVTVTFKGKYSGTKRLSFKILPAEVSTCKVALSTTSYTYNGKAKTPSVTVKNAAGKTLKKGTDYTVTYASGRKNAGTYKVTVKMKGNYSGTKVLTFKIKPISVSKCSAKLFTTSYVYNGKVKTPTVTVKDSAGKTLKKGTDYTVTYAKGRKNVGTYKVTIKMKGNYSGTKVLTFKIVPKAASINKLTAKSKAILVKLNRVTTQSTGYQIQYSTSSKFTSAKTVNVSSYKTSSKTISGLKKGKKYYVRVRTYKTVGGKKYYSSWSSYKSVKTK